MKFLIFRDFSRIFRICFRFLRIKNNLKKKRLKRGVNFRAGPTWVRRGTQGHVAKPHGPTRAPAWRRGDTWLLFIFIIYRIYYIYRSFDYQKINLLTLITASPFKLRVSPYFYSVGLCSTHFILNTGYVDQC